LGDSQTNSGASARHDSCLAPQGKERQNTVVLGGNGLFKLCVRNSKLGKGS
jgi:hypothetical protein